MQPTCVVGKFNSVSHTCQTDLRYHSNENFRILSEKFDVCCSRAALPHTVVLLFCFSLLTEEDVNKTPKRRCDYDYLLNLSANYKYLQRNKVIQNFFRKRLVTGQHDFNDGSITEL